MISCIHLLVKVHAKKEMTINIRHASRKAPKVSSFRMVAAITNFFTPCDENRRDIASTRRGIMVLS